MRWLTGFSEYLRKRDILQVQQDWTYSLFASYQFLLHILLWWSLWGAHDATAFNFMKYLYLLSGPILLFLGSSVLVPDVINSKIDLRDRYYVSRKLYFTILSLIWIWAIFIRPVLHGEWAAYTPVFVIFLVLSAILRFTDNVKIHFVGAVINWLLVLVFVGFFSMRLD